MLKKEKEISLNVTSMLEAVSTIGVQWSKKSAWVLYGQRMCLGRYRIIKDKSIF